MRNDRAKYRRPVLLGVLGLLAALGVDASVRAQCEVAQLGSPGGKIGDAFGQSVSLCHNVAAIGDPLAFSAAGAVYVFRHDGTEWVQEAMLTAPEPDAEDAFASSVAISGDVVVVSAYAADTPEFHGGAAYIYRYAPDASGWALEASLTASDGDFNDIFGFSVSVDSDVALIGARDDENEGVSKSGSAYVFRYTGSEWIEEAKLVDPDGTTLMSARDRPSSSDTTLRNGTWRPS
jgi:hypothetical protein